MKINAVQKILVPALSPFNKLYQRVIEEKKVLIVFDLDNFSSIRRHLGAINIPKLCKILANGRPVHKAIVYSSTPADEQEQSESRINFFSLLKANGIEVIEKKRQKRQNQFGMTYERGYADIEIVGKIFQELSSCNTVILVSGDRDFCILADIFKNYLVTMGIAKKRLEVVGIQKTMSNQLQLCADKFWDLEQMFNEVQYKKATAISS